MSNHNKQNAPRRKSTHSRRDIIRYGVAGALGVTALGPLGKGLLQEASAAPLPAHRRAVVIYCYGGYDGLQMTVPTGTQAYYDRRPNISIDAGTVLDINHTGYGLNPLLTNMHAVHADPGGLQGGSQLAVFQKVGYPDDDLSHFNSQDFYSWGVRNGFDSLSIPESGWIARFADAYTADSLGACSVGVGRPADIEGSAMNPLAVGNLQGFDFDTDGLYADNHQIRIDAVKSLLAGYAGTGLDASAKTALEQAHNLTNQIQAAVDTYTPPTGPAYPTSTPGRYLEDIARMIQAGFGTKIFFTGFSGWDNHSNILTSMGNRQARLDDALGAFIAHCKEMSIWDDMLIVVESEFGRRIFENGSLGTDHGHGNCFFAMGGGVNGGYYGPDLTTSEMENNNWLDYSIDFRDIRKEMVTDWFGGDGNLIFPEPQDINTNLNYLS